MVVPLVVQVDCAQSLLVRPAGGGAVRRGFVSTTEEERRQGERRVDVQRAAQRGDLFLEVKQSLLVARARGGPKALTPRDALRLATRGGAAVLGPPEWSP